MSVVWSGLKTEKAIKRKVVIPIRHFLFEKGKHYSISNMETFKPRKAKLKGFMFSGFCFGTENNIRSWGAIRDWK